MKISCCREKWPSRFSLSGSAPDVFVPGPQSAALWLEYEERLPEKAVAKNAPVYPGMLLARHPNPGKGDLHCPVTGVVSEAGPQGALIAVGLPAPKTPKKTENEETPPGSDAEAKVPEIPVTRPVNLETLNGEELARALKELGIHTDRLTCLCDTLIINGLNPDPGVLWAGPMLKAQTDVIKAGVSLLHRLTPATNLILAIGQGMDTEFADLDVRPVPAVYPSSLDPLVIKSVTGKECPTGVCVVGLHEIWKLGRVARTGLPVTETVLTLNGVNYLAPLGTPARDLLGFAGITLNDGDALIFNGPLRGVAQSRPEIGVTSQTYGICVIRKDETPPLQGAAPCIACGECVRVCPARIQPDLLSRHAELGQDAKCGSLHIEACLNCGLCTYVCLARRPVLQHLRLARRRMSV